MNARATFTTMESSTAQDWAAIRAESPAFFKALPDRILAHLKLLDGDHGGFAVDRYTHSLQTATLALKDGRDEEYVVCALLHDIGDTLGCSNHFDVAAAILHHFAPASQETVEVEPVHRPDQRRPHDRGDQRDREDRRPGPGGRYPKPRKFAPVNGPRFSKAPGTKKKGKPPGGKPGK
jgi:hypothetical protein